MLVVAAFALMTCAVIVVVARAVERPRSIDGGEARSLGLEQKGNIYFGTRDGLSIEAGLPSDRGAVEQRVVVRPFPTPEYLGPHATRAFAPLVLTGDAAFDRSIAICGDDVAIRGALDATTRVAVRAQQLRVHYGQLDGHYRTNEALEQILQLAVVLHHRFVCTPEERLAQLEANVRHDPSAGVRAHNVDALARVPGGLERADALARANEIDESLRLRAAVVAGSSDVLAAVASSTADGDRLAIATEALGSFRSSELPRALDRVRELLGTSPSVPLIRVLGRYGAVADVPLLTSILDAANLRTASRDAIRSIQARVFGSDAGALAIADLQGGELAEADGGSLAVTRTEKEDPPS